MRRGLACFLYYAVWATAAGCQRGITVEPYDGVNGVNTAGLVYHLPKTVLKVTIPYTVRRTTTLENGVPKTAAPAKSVIIKDPITLTTIVTADQANTFVISASSIAHDVFLSTTYKFSVNEEGVLTAVSSDIADKGGEVTKDFVSAGLSVAKVLIAGQGQPQPLIDAQSQIAAIDAEIIKESRSSDTPEQKDKAIKTLLAWRADIGEFIKLYQSSNGNTTEDTTFGYEYVFDPSTAPWKKEGNEEYVEIKAPDRYVDNLSAASLPEVRLYVGATPDELKASGRKYFDGKRSSVKGGIIYRTPVNVPVRIAAGPDHVEVLRQSVPILQLSPFNIAEAKVKVWGQASTTVVFSPKTGGIQDYGQTTTASAADSAALAKDAAAQAQAAYADIEKVKSAAQTDVQKRTADYTQQAALVQAELAARKAQQELEDYKKAHPEP